MDRSINHRKYKLALISLKYIPIITAFMMLVHVFLLIVGKPSFIAESLAGVTLLPSLIIYFFSNALHFCWLHKCFTLYTLVTDVCIKTQRYIGFGISVEFLRIVMFLIGIFLFVCLFKDIKGYHRRNYINT